MARITISLPDSYVEALKARASGNVSGLVARLLERSGVVPDPMPRTPEAAKAAPEARSAPRSPEGDTPGSATWRRARTATATGRAEIKAYDEAQEEI